MTTTNASSYAVLSAGKTIVGEIFGGALPLIVTGAFTTGFVSMLSVGNLTGRVGWGAASDYFGRRKTFMAAWGLGIPMYLVRIYFTCWGLNSKSCCIRRGVPTLTHIRQGIPLSIHMVTDNPSPVALGLFCTCAVVNASIFGATAAVVPAYLADLMGPKVRGPWLVIGPAYMLAHCTVF
jgi:MFS family permease